jgi:hypothetical protein
MNLSTYRSDAFEQRASAQESLIQEYFERSQRRSEDDKWIKANKPSITGAMAELAKDKADFGLYRVSISTPDESRFDMEKVLEFLANDVPEGVFSECTKVVVDEDALMKRIEDGTIDLDILKAAAWIEKTGTPRLSIKERK